MLPAPSRLTTAARTAGFAVRRLALLTLMAGSLLLLTGCSSGQPRPTQSAQTASTSSTAKPSSNPPGAVAAGATPSRRHLPPRTRVVMDFIVAQRQRLRARVDSLRGLTGAATARSRSAP